MSPVTFTATIMWFRDECRWGLARRGRTQAQINLGHLYIQLWRTE